MDQVFIDNALIVSSLLCAVFVTQCLHHRKAGPVFSTLLLFPPLLVFLNMWAHTVAVTAINIKRYLDGNFHYTFTLYSQLLFGVVFILLSGATVHYSRNIFKEISAKNVLCIF